MLKQLISYRYKLSPVILLLLGLGLISLACSLGSEGAAKPLRIKNSLATLTPTAAAVSQAEAPVEAQPQPAEASLNQQPAPAEAVQIARLPTLTPTPLSQPASVAFAAPTQPAANPGTTVDPSATPTEWVFSEATATPATPGATPPPAAGPLPTLPPPADPTKAPKSKVAGWSFRGVQTWHQQDSMLVIGEIINNTGKPQQAVDITGTFYDDKDQVIKNELDILSHVAVDVVPVGAHIPFELVIESSQPVYRLDLLALSEPADNPPRQDFQFANISQQQNESNLYCLEGQIQNIGSPLADYLIVVAIGYNAQGNVVSFGEYSPASPSVILGDQASPFEMCLDPLDQQIARHELRALGY